MVVVVVAAAKAPSNNAAPIIDTVLRIFVFKYTNR
jgi:hypothetical protein